MNVENGFHFANWSTSMHRPTHGPFCTAFSWMMTTLGEWLSTLAPRFGSVL